MVWDLVLTIKPPSTKTDNLLNCNHLIQTILRCTWWKHLNKMYLSNMPCDYSEATQGTENCQSNNAAITVLYRINRINPVNLIPWLSIIYSFKWMTDPFAFKDFQVHLRKYYCYIILSTTVKLLRMIEVSYGSVFLANVRILLNKLRFALF